MSSDPLDIAEQPWLPQQMLGGSDFMGQFPGLAQEGTSPCAVVFADNLYLFWVDEDSTKVKYTSYNELSWQHTVTLDDHAAGLSILGETTPSAVVFNGALYVFFTGVGVDGIWYTYSSAPRADGTVIWSQVARCGLTTSSRKTSPAAVAYQDQIWVFAPIVVDGSAILRYTQLSNNAWTAPVTVSTGDMKIQTFGAPAGVVYQSALYLYVQTDNLGHACANFSSATPTFTTISNESLLPGTNSAVTNFLEAQIIQIYVGPEMGDLLCVVSTDGTNYSPTPTPLFPANAAFMGIRNSPFTSPAIATYRSIPYVFWVNTNGFIWFSRKWRPAVKPS